MTEVTPGIAFADVTQFGDIVLRFRHMVRPDGGGSAITVRIEAEGPGEASVGPIVADDLPQAVAALAALAEQRTFAA